jgi:endonuclease YncB( thermonuclease family)
MLHDAAEKAKYLTYRSNPGKFTSHLNRLRRDMPALRLVVPFMNTVNNLLKFGIERSPLPVMVPGSNSIKRAIQKGGPEAYVAVSRMLTGTFLIGLAMDLTFAGKMTGGGPGRPGDRKQWMDVGAKPYSIRLGDQFLYINHTDPVGGFLANGAMLAETLMNDGEGITSWQDVEEAITAAAFGAAHVALDKTALSGISQMVTALEDPERYSHNYGKRFIANFLVPNIVAHTATALDPTNRYARTVIEQIQSRIPYWRDSLVPVRDGHGREVSYASDMGAFYDFVSPFYLSRFEPEPIDREMMKMGERIVGMPNMLKAKWSDREALVNLFDHSMERSRFHQLIGQTKPSEMAVPPARTVDFTANSINVIDGDSFEVDVPGVGVRKYRLAGIDAEEKVAKEKNPKQYDKRLKETAVLRAALQAGPVTIQDIGIGDHGEVVATVTVDGDISASLARNGITGGKVHDGNVENILAQVSKSRVLKDSQRRTRAASALIGRYGDRTRLEALNAMVGEEDPGGPMGEMWEAWRSAEDNAARKKLVEKIEDDYYKAAKNTLLVEFPWIERDLRNPKAEAVNVHPAIKGGFEYLEQREPLELNVPVPVRRQ